MTPHPITELFDTLGVENIDYYSDLVSADSDFRIAVSPLTQRQRVVAPMRDQKGIA